MNVHRNGKMAPEADALATRPDSAPTPTPPHKPCSFAGAAVCSATAAGGSKQRETELHTVHTALAESRHLFIETSRQGNHNAVRLSNDAQGLCI